MPIRKQSSARNNNVSSSSPYTSRTHDAIDLEKQPSYNSRGRPNRRRRRRSSFDSSASDSDYSPPPPVVATSYEQAHQPMLGASTLRRTRAGVGFRVPNRIMRWLCLALFSALVLFIITLFRFTLASTVLNVPIPTVKPDAKPPVWESFPFLVRYRGGLRSLVPRNSQKPEYPGDGSEGLGLEADASAGAEKNGVQARDGQSSSLSSSVFNPYPDYSSSAYVSKYGE